MNNSRVPTDPPRNRLFGVAQVVRTVRPETILFDGFGSNLWRTDDAGATYRHIPTLGNLTLSDFVTHPLDAGKIMARASDNTGVDTLFVTDNAGNGWRPVQSYIYFDRFAWGHEGDMKSPSIWILEWPQKTGRPNLANQFDLQLVSSHDEFQSPGKVELKHAVDFLVDWRERIMLAAVLRSNDSTALQLYASPDLGRTFYAASFPGDLSEQFYTFLDHADNRVFVHVRNHRDADFGNVFGSDAIGLQYSQSILQVSVENGQVEFRPMRGMQGIYFANQKRVPNNEFDARVITVMSSDNGGTWAPILSNRVLDERGQPIACSHDEAPDGLVGCFLSFSVLGKSSSRPQRSIGSFHSTARAPGFAVAVGNVGPWYDRAENDADAHSTFLTRDAGATWLRIRNGSHIAEIADQGNVIVLAHDSRSTDTLVYSIDAGQTWSECMFTTQPMLVTNIISEPTTSGTDVIVFGTAWSEGKLRGFVVYVEFKEYDQQCTANDYENWYPVGSDCLLGQRIVYRRRKAGAHCHADTQPPAHTSPCECEVSDYECDFCYARVGNGPCARVYNPSDCPQVLPQPDYCVGNTTRTKGYRRIAGNACHPPHSMYEPDVIPCVGGSGGASDVALVVALILVGVLLVAIVVCIVQFRRNHRFNRWVRSLGLPGIRPPQALAVSAFAEESSTAIDDDLLNDQGHY
jgi:hypothetical protein